MLTLLLAVALSQDAAPPPPPPPADAVQAVQAAEAANPYAGRSRGWLRAEREQLQARRPILVPQGMVLGGGLFAAAISLVCAIQPRESAATFFIGFSIATAAAAVAAAVFLYFGIRERSDIDLALADVEAAMDAAPQYQPPPPMTPPPNVPSNLPPPPPPPPPAI
jgi:hypothetical protein